MPAVRAVDGIVFVQSGVPKSARSPDATVPKRRTSVASPAKPLVGVRPVMGGNAVAVAGAVAVAVVAVAVAVAVAVVVVAVVAVAVAVVAVAVSVVAVAVSVVVVVVLQIPLASVTVKSML